MTPAHPRALVSPCELPEMTTKRRASAAEPGIPPSDAPGVVKSAMSPHPDLTDLVVFLLTYRTLDLPYLEVHEVPGFDPTMRAFVLAKESETLPILELRSCHAQTEFSVGHAQLLSELQSES